MQDVTAQAIAAVTVRMAVRVAADMDATFIARIVVMRIVRIHAEMDATGHVKKVVEKHVVELAKEAA